MHNVPIRHIRHITRRAYYNAGHGLPFASPSLALIGVRRLARCVKLNAECGYHCSKFEPKKSWIGEQSNQPKWSFYRKKWRYVTTLTSLLSGLYMSSPHRNNSPEYLARRGGGQTKPNDVSFRFNFPPPPPPPLPPPPHHDDDNDDDHHHPAAYRTTHHTLSLSHTHTHTHTVTHTHTRAHTNILQH